MVTMVLLNVDWMKATPSATCRFSFVLPLTFCLRAMVYFFAFFLPATVLALPLRVRALLRVR